MVDHQTSTPYDCVIVGGGPTGLFGAFYAGLRGMRTLLVESLDRLGGQPAILYPEKWIYDVPGFVKIRGGELVQRLIEQGGSTGAEFRTGCTVQKVERLDDLYHLDLSDGSNVATRGILIATGIGAFRPRRHPLAALDDFTGRGVMYGIKNLADLRDRRVVVVGGGDAAVDWALTAMEVTDDVAVVHRRNAFRAMEESVERLRRSPAKILTPCEITGCRGNDRLEAVDVKDLETGDITTVPCDEVIVCIGYHSDLGPVNDWGLLIEDGKIQVGPTMATNLERVYAAGDVVSYPGKIELIAVGFTEAAIAINHLKHDLEPEASVQPARSSSTGVKMAAN